MNRNTMIEKFSCLTKVEKVEVEEGTEVRRKVYEAPKARVLETSGTKGPSAKTYITDGNGYQS